MQNPQTQPQQGRTSGDNQAVSQIHGMLHELRDRARQNIDTVQNPKAQALLEATAEVVQGLMKAYEDYQQGQEKAWQ